MLRSRRRLLLLLSGLVSLLIVTACLYMLGMTYLEGEPRGFWRAFEWAGESLSTTGYGADSSWRHPLMIVYVVLVQFIGVFLVFLVIPIYLIPFLEERFETRLPKDAPKMSDHVIIFHHSPTVATVLGELKRAKIKTLVVEEEQAEARRLVEQVHRVLYGNLDPRHILGAALAGRASQKVSPTVAGIQHLGNKLQVTEVRITRESVLAGKTLSEAGLRQHSGVMVIGQWFGGKLITPPMPGMRLEAGAILVLVGTAESIGKFMEVCAGTKELRRHGRFLVAGGGEVGRKVVELLTDAGEETLLIDNQPRPGVDIVGNVLDTQILKQANIEDAQAVIVALSADTTTLFTTVIIKDLAPDVPVIARVNRAENVERIYAAGADFALSISQVSGQLLAWRLLGSETVDIDADLRVVKVSVHGIEGRHPSELGIREKTGCSAVTVERGDDLLVEFGKAFRFQDGDALYICGSAEATQKYGERFIQN